jgi:phosphohistidine phosphatase
MVKQLLLVRHAEAETPYLGQKDYDRELTSHGIITASVTGKKLKEMGFNADFILTSAAKRANTTAILLAEQLDYPVDSVQAHTEIYACNLSLLLEYVNRIDDKFNHVILVNHNPNISYLAEYLTNENLHGGLNPIGIANITFELENWHKIRQHTGKLVWYKELYYS